MPFKLMIRELLIDKTAEEKADIKGQEIAKIGSVVRTNVSFSGADYDIEVISINPIKGGLEVFAKAWDTQGQIGFGKDGTIDIERFRIFNPPILVDDPAGDIQKISIDRETGKTRTRILREDPQLALLQSLAHIIKISTADNPRGNIIENKVGNTTSTFYPDPDVESTSVDGTIANATTGTWATVHDATAGTTAFDNTDPDETARETDNGTNWTDIWRAFYLFDTSSIPDTDTIDSATFSIHGHGSAAVDAHSQTINVYSSSPASNTALVTGDFDQVGTTAFSNTNLAVTGGGGWDPNNYNDWAFNASGLAGISKTGISKFSVRLSGDATNTEPSKVNGNTSFGSHYAEQTGTTKDPKLVVVHSSAATSVRSRMLLGIGQ